MVVGVCAELAYYIFNNKKFNIINYLFILIYILATLLTSKRMLCIIILLVYMGHAYLIAAHMWISKEEIRIYLGLMMKNF